jgi:phosphoribosylamine--glycine ligase
VKVLVIGSGGREHALVWKLAQSPRVTQLYCAPGNAGIESLATCVPLSVEDIPGLKQFVTSHAIDLTIVGPEAPLALGIVDEFRKSKLKIFGPTRAAAPCPSSSRPMAWHKEKESWWRRRAKRRVRPSSRCWNSIRLGRPVAVS